MTNVENDIEYFDSLTEGVKEAFKNKDFDLVKIKMDTLIEFVNVLEREDNALKGRENIKVK